MREACEAESTVGEYMMANHISYRYSVSITPLFTNLRAIHGAHLKRVIVRVKVRIVIENVGNPLTAPSLNNSSELTEPPPTWDLMT
jgi:hypothetical protein